MKKTTILITLFVILSITLNACVKSYSCECKLNDYPDVVVGDNIIVGTKKAAKSSCENKSSVSGGYTCSLK